MTILDDKLLGLLAFGGFIIVLNLTRPPEYEYGTVEEVLACGGGNPPVCGALVRLDDGSQALAEVQYGAKVGMPVRRRVGVPRWVPRLDGEKKPAGEGRANSQ